MADISFINFLLMFYLLVSRYQKPSEKCLEIYCILFLILRVTIKTRKVFLLDFCYSVLKLEPHIISEFKSCYLKLPKISKTVKNCTDLKFVKFRTRKDYYWLIFPVATFEGGVCIIIYMSGNDLKLVSSNRLLETLACIFLKEIYSFLLVQS